jgi:hypothetical protein
MSTTTIVSAFLKSANERKDRTTEIYLEHGKRLIECGISMVLFMDESLIETEYFQNPPEHLCILPFKRENIYLYDNQYKDQLTDFNVSTDFSEKDTLDYMLLICNKTEFIRDAIEKNPFSCEQFVWVDFGIHHIFPQDNPCYFKECIQTTFSQTNPESLFQTVRIGSIWNPYMNYFNHPEDIYKKIAWYFAGGVFGGSKEKLLEFSRLTKNKCLQVIQERKSIMWEVNVWYLVFQENASLFSPYSCDHNASLIFNYNEIEPASPDNEV